MKGILLLTALPLLALASPAASEGERTEDYELSSAVRAEAELQRLTKDSIAHPEMANYLKAREDLDALLMRDLDDPAVSQWISGNLEGVGWLFYGPPTIYVITAHEPLRMDQAALFRHFMSMVLEFDAWDADDDSACLGVKALRLLKDGAASPEEEAYLNAFLIGAEIGRLAMRSDNYRRAMGLDPQFFADADQDEATLSTASDMDGAKSSMLWKAAVFGEALDESMIENDFWFNLWTEKEYERNLLDRALSEAAAPEYRDRIAGSRPFFAYVEAEREKGAATVVRALCE